MIFKINFKNLKMEKTILEVGTILYVKPNFDLKSGNYTDSSTKFVKVFAVTKNGTPQIIPLNNDLTQKNSYYKNMKWANNGWKVYGHYTEIYTPK
jgi:hypothetical protein